MSITYKNKNSTNTNDDKNVCSNFKNILKWKQTV